MSEISKDHYLYGFSYQRTLSQDKVRLVALGKAPLDGVEGVSSTEFEDVILVLDKIPIDQSFLATLQDDASESEDKTRHPLRITEELGENDVYRWCNVHVNDAGEGGYKATVIRPATQAHITKYTKHEVFMITETPEMYRQKVLPWIESQPIKRIQWVYNILDRQKEADTILHETPGTKEGFIIVPDMKWDSKTLGSLYLVAIVHDRSIRSLRDLTVEHVPLLQSILREGTRVAQERYNLQANSKQLGSLRCFIHYQPTYYHFHVHLLNANHDSHPGAITGQAHLLQDVIDLLLLGVNFKERTLTYSMAVNHPLFEHVSPNADEDIASKKQRLA